MKKIMSCCLLYALSIFICGYSGCSTLGSVQVNHYTDQYDNYQTWTLENNHLPNSFFCFDLEKYLKANDNTYFIRLKYWSPNWLFIESGESLILLVDGKRMGFSGDGSIKNRIVDGEFVRETAIYPITKKQLKAIANAETVSAKIIGQNIAMEAVLNKENIANINQFYNDYVLNKIDKFNSEATTQ